MAIRAKQLTNARQAIEYALEELARYYAKERDPEMERVQTPVMWLGKLAVQFGLEKEPSVQEFIEAYIRVMSGEYPTIEGEKLTARLNKTRKEMVWVVDELTQQRQMVEREVPNRRPATEFTISLDKPESVYLEKTHDEFFYREVALVALREELELMESKVQTQVNEQGKDFDQTTGKALIAVMEHHTARPVDGIPDPHTHWHCQFVNVTEDPEKRRRLAAEFGKLFEDKAYHQAHFHNRIWELALKHGYGYRRTSKGLEMTVLHQREARMFSKRTIQIEAVEKKERLDLERKAAAIVRSKARDGIFLDPKLVYIDLKDRLGEQTRKGKQTASVRTRPELESAWSKQLPPGRWAEITKEAARNGDRIGFLDMEQATRLAILHAFEKKSVIREVDLFASIAQYGAGTMTNADVDRWMRDDPRLVRNSKVAGMVTTHRIIAEERAIRDIA